MDKPFILKLIAEVLEVEVDSLLQFPENESLRLLSMNSLKAIRLIVKIEEILEGEIEDDDYSVDKVDTIENVVQFVAKYKQSIQT